MRYAAIIVPFSIALAAAGIVMILSARQPPVRTETPYVLGEIRHAVTEQMLRDAGRFSDKPAPHFRLKDAHGIDVQIGGAGKKAQFVYFILKGCPCSADAQPLFNALYRRYQAKIDFIGVISEAKAGALDYAGESNVLHPIVSDEKREIIKAYGAKQSVYCALIRPDGTIDKMWPGYSAPMLLELNEKLSGFAGTAVQPFDTKWAPKKLASGCYF